MTSDTPRPGKKFEHYKGGKYRVQLIANNSETNEPMVIYQSLDHGSMWARPLSEWNKEVDGQPHIKRFWEIKP